LSIERISRKRGTGWRVRWRDGARNRARTFDRKADAVAFEAETRRRRLGGDLRALDAGRETLQEFAEEWWRLYAVPNLARTTLASYASLWDAHVLPRLGATPLRELDPLTLTSFRAELTSEGVGPASTRRVMVILQGVLERAVEWQRIPTNPARAVRKPPQRRERAVRPLSPLDVERLRAHLLTGGRLRDAVLVSVLAYAGLRPGEALALTWSHVRKRTILVERAAALGELKTTKTARTRTVRLLHPRIPIYLVPRGDGFYMVGATTIESDSRSPVSARSLMELLGAAYALHPAFGEAEVVEIGVEARPAFPDNLPRVWREGNTITVNGLYRHGFLLAPAMAQQAAALAFGEAATPEESDADRLERQAL